MATVLSSGPTPAMDVSPLDAYLQPTPAGPIPAVMPATGMRASAVPTQMCFLYTGFPVHTSMTMMPTCVAGPGPGVVSGMPMSACRSAKGSTNVIVMGQQLARAGLDPSQENGLSANSIGVSSPSQATLLNPMG